MLRSTRLLVLATLSVPALIAVGCTVKSVDTPNQVQTGSGGGTSTSSSSSSSTSSSTSSTSSSSGVGGSGVGGSGAGGGTCAGTVGAGTPVDSSCDSIPAAAAPHTCGTGTDAPPDMAICHQGFKIYTQGAAELLGTCIGAIPVAASNCADADAGGPIEACVKDMYTKACANPQADALCDQIKTTCDGLSPAQPFDDVKCKGDLVPFSETGGLTPFNDCFNGLANDPCQTAYDTCFAQVTTAP